MFCYYRDCWQKCLMQVSVCRPFGYQLHICSFPARWCFPSTPLNISKVVGWREGHLFIIRYIRANGEGAKEDFDVRIAYI